MRPAPHRTSWFTGVDPHPRFRGHGSAAVRSRWSRSLVVAGSIGLLAAAAGTALGSSPPALAVGAMPPDAPTSGMATPTITDLSTLGGVGFGGATAIDGTVVVGSGGTTPGELHAVAIDLAAASPHVVDLGTLGGGWSFATAVSGTIVVGSSSYAGAVGGAWHAFAYDLGAASPHMIDLGTFGGADSRALAVDGSTVVGYSYTTGNATNHAFAYDLGSPAPAMIDLGTLGGASSIASAVDDGVVVGSASTADGFSSHAFTYDLGSPTPAMVDLGTFGGNDSSAVAVDGGVVTGTAELPDNELDPFVEHAFAYDLDAAQPTLVDLGTLGPSSSKAAAIDGEVIVGTSYTPDDIAARAFAYDSGAASPTMVDLGTLGGYFSHATAVGGQVVVGFSSTLGRRFDHAFAYDLAAPSPTMVDLGTLGGTQSTAVAVDGDLVIGSARTAGDAETHAVVWSLVPLPRVVPGSASVVEGDSGTRTVEVPVTLSQPFSRPVAVRWNTLQVDGAPPDQADLMLDYTPSSGTVTFAPGETEVTAAVPIDGDTAPENDEYLVVSFHDPINATIGGWWGIGFASIHDDDQPTLVPGSTSVTEGNAGTTAMRVPITLSSPSAVPVTVAWTTLFAAGAPGHPADPSVDYTAASGTVTFAPGQTSATAAIAIHGDATVEPDEYVVISFHDAAHAKIGGVWGLGAGTITNDD